MEDDSDCDLVTIPAGLECHGDINGVVSVQCGPWSNVSCLEPYRLDVKLWLNTEVKSCWNVLTRIKSNINIFVRMSPRPREQLDIPTFRILIIS